jgi:hypothetical protein
MKEKSFNISAHTPTEDKEDEIKSAFYDKLDWLYLRVPNHDIKIIMGDMNAKIGKDPEYHMWDTIAFMMNLITTA